MLTRAKLRASVNPAAARSCLNSSVSLLSGNCEHVKQAHKNTQTIRSDKMAFGYPHIHLTYTHSYLVSYCIGAWCGAGYVVETIGNGGVLHDITSVDDVWSRGWDLDLNLITNTSSLGAEAHPSQQLGNFLCWLTVRGKWNNHYSLQGANLEFFFSWFFWHMRMYNSLTLTVALDYCHLKHCSLYQRV